MSRNDIRILLISTAVSFLINGAKVVGELFVCWNGSVAGILLYMTPILAIPAMGGCIIAALCALVGFFSRFRKGSLLTLLCALIFSGSYLACNTLACELRRQIFVAAAKRGEPLAEAISKFERQKGHPPLRLAELVPSYISALPSTGMVTTPDFSYHVYSQTKEPRWELTVQPVELPNADGLFYWPQGNYPGQIVEGHIERTDDWVFISN